MICPHCQSDTSVKDTRLADNGTIRRRRVCENGHKLITWESTVDPSFIIRRRQTRARLEKGRRERLGPEECARRDHLKYLRRQARQEAKETRQPVEAVFARWGLSGGNNPTGAVQ